MFKRTPGINSHFVLAGNQQTAYSSNQINFSACAFSESSGTNENAQEIIYGINFVSELFIAFFRGNTKDEDFTCMFRKDNSTIQIVTVGAGLLGQFNDNTPATVLATEAVNFSKDTSASTSGTMNMSMMVRCRG